MLPMVWTGYRSVVQNPSAAAVSRLPIAAWGSCWENFESHHLMVWIAYEKFRLPRGGLTDEFVGSSTAQGLEATAEIICVDELLKQPFNVGGTGESDAFLDYPVEADTPRPRPGILPARKPMLDSGQPTGTSESAFAIDFNKWFRVQGKHPMDAEGNVSN